MLLRTARRTNDGDVEIDHDFVIVDDERTEKCLCPARTKRQRRRRQVTSSSSSSVMIPSGNKWWRMGAVHLATLVTLIFLLVFTTARAELLLHVPSSHHSSSPSSSSVNGEKNRNKPVQRFGSAVSQSSWVGPAEQSRDVVASSQRVPADVAKKVESHLLAALGLKQAPIPGKGNKQRAPVHVPQYMLDLYSKVSFLVIFRHLINSAHYPPRTMDAKMRIFLAVHEEIFVFHILVDLS